MEEKAKKIKGFLKPHTMPVERKKRNPEEETVVSSERKLLGNTNVGLTIFTTAEGPDVIGLLTLSRDLLYLTHELRGFGLEDVGFCAF